MYEGIRIIMFGETWNLRIFLVKCKILLKFFVFCIVTVILLLFGFFLNLSDQKKNILWDFLKNREERKRKGKGDVNGQVT